MPPARSGRDTEWCDVIHQTRGAPSAPDTDAVLKLAATLSQAASSLAQECTHLNQRLQAHASRARAACAPAAPTHEDCTSSRAGCRPF